MFKSTVPVVINGLKGLNVLKPWRFLLAAQNTQSHPGSNPDKLTYLGSNATMEIQMLEDDPCNTTTSNNNQQQQSATKLFWSKKEKNCNDVPSISANAITFIPLGIVGIKSIAEDRN